MNMRENSDFINNSRKVKEKSNNFSLIAKNKK